MLSLKKKKKKSVYLFSKLAPFINNLFHVYSGPTDYFDFYSDPHFSLLPHI